MDEPKKTKSKYWLSFEAGRKCFLDHYYNKKKYREDNVILTQLVHSQKLYSTRFGHLVEITKIKETHWKKETNGFFRYAFARGYFQCAYETFPQLLKHDVNIGEKKTGPSQ